MKNPLKGPCKAFAVVIAIAQVAAIDCCSLHASDRIQAAGDVLQFALPAAAAGLTLGHWDGEGALQLSESLGVTLGATYGLKYTLEERRPNGGTQSFPSAHSSVAFASAEFMRKRYGWAYGAPAYAAASFVAYSRVEARDHYVHDVVAGAGIGILSSYLFTKPYHGWQVSVDGDSKGFDVRLAHAF